MFQATVVLCDCVNMSTHNADDSIATPTMTEQHRIQNIILTDNSIYAGRKNINLTS